MKKKDKKVKDLKISILDYVAWFLGAIVISYVICAIGGCMVLNVGFDGIWYVINNGTVLICTLILSVIMFIPMLYVMHVVYERSYIRRRLKGENSAIDGNLENSHFSTRKEMLEKGYRIYKSVDELQEAEDGIIFNFEESEKGIDIVFAPETIHSLILGTTGSGKTTSYIIPSIKALAMTSTKPSFLFTDPKGELAEKTAWFLKQQGYDVLTMDFRRPEKSLRWNPLAYAYDKYHSAVQVREQSVYKNGKHHFLGNEYIDDEIEDAIKAEQQRLEDEAFEDVCNIVSAICPVNEKDPIWDNGAKSFIQSVALAMLEDSNDPECNISIDNFCFYNIAKICSKTDNDCKALHRYFDYRKKTSPAVQYSRQVLNSPDKQRGSYLSSVAEKLMMFNDRGICNMTSGAGEIDVQQMDEKPTAVYLILPDEKVGRHPLGSLFISETYKKLVAKAVTNGGALKRRCYFIMDEYGNMPKIDGVASMFTVGRSRGIIQMPVIQAYSQLIDKYGRETSRTIFGNCNIEIFIGAKDDDTCEKFSKKLGNYSVVSTSVNGGGRKNGEHSYGESIKERPLMYPRELSLLNNKQDMGNAVIINQGYSPSMGKFTPYFRSKWFDSKAEPFASVEPRALDEEEIFYDFEQRARNIEATMQELDEYMSAVEEGPEQTVADDTAEQQCRVTASSILEKLKPFIESIGKTFTDDTAENLKAINELVEKLRADKSILKLNQVIKLKLQYEQILEEEKLQEQEQDK